MPPQLIENPYYQGSDSNLSFTVDSQPQVINNPYFPDADLPPVLAAQDTHQYAGQLFEDLHDKRKAAKDVGAILKGVQTGVLNQQQAESAMASARKEYGDGVLLDLPQARQWYGLEQQFEEKKKTAIGNVAKQFGLPEHFFKWDDREGKVVANRDAIEITNIKQAFQDRRVKQMQLNIEALRSQYNIAVNLAEMQAKNRKGGVEDSVKQQMNQLRNEMFTANKNLRELIGMPDSTAAPAPVTEPGTSMAEAVSGTPAAPVTTPSPPKRFDSQEAATAAWQAGEIQKGSVFFYKGNRVKLIDDKGNMEYM